MELTVTPSIRKLLTQALECVAVSEELRTAAQQYAQTDRVPWSVIKACNEALRPALVARLDKLQQELDNKMYAEMVADITEVERKAEDQRGSILPSTRLQLSFGAHVLVTMFSFFALGYYGSKWYLEYDELWAGLLGVLGLTSGLLIETLLLIIRTNRPEPLEERMPHLFDTQAIKESFQVVKQAKAAKKAGKGATSALAQASSIERSSDNKKKL